MEEIDSLNILGATMLAMERAYKGLGILADIALVDGNRLPSGIDCHGECIIKGDASSSSIAAASILAKVSRDRYMVEMAEKYPQYQFEKHKGYGTKLHRELLLEHGPSPIHRQLFIRKILGGGNG